MFRVTGRRRVSESLAPAQTAPSSVGELFTEFLDGIVAALPRIVGGVVFLVGSYLVVRLTLGVVRRVLREVYPADQGLVVDLSVAVVGVFLWFGVALALLNIVGLGDVAASLGTASGFVGLGVAFALKEMIADTVAGVYLIRDPDFEVGDRVETAGVTGEVVGVGLRKARIETDDGTLVVLANREVEKKWENESRTQSTAPTEL
jgi:small-conductance mechanosensitive channel